MTYPKAEKFENHRREMIVVELSAILKGLKLPIN